MHYFGTDGIRDVAGQGRLAPEVLRRVGLALARYARGHAGAKTARVAIGRDPRPSGPAILEILAATLAAEGVEVEDLGVVPTPAVAWYVATQALDLGLSISASHNPPEYNGVKPFAPGGRKLEPEEEARLEAWAAELPGRPAPPASPRVVGAAALYAASTARWLADGGRLDGLRLVVDLAAGATTTTAPLVLEALGAHVRALHPAGQGPINEGCGTEHAEALRAALAQGGADAGLAFDGDGDRVIVAEPAGGLLDGDDALAILAEDALRAGGVPGRCVVSTVMANLGLEERLASFDVTLERTDVGDRHVAARMRERGAAFGAEPSGHVVLEREGALIGDGLVAGVRILQAARRLGRPLADLQRATPRYPQLLVNVRVAERRPLEDDPELARALARARTRLAGRGRLVVRYSGTEPLLRIMAEGHDAREVEEVVEDLAAAVRLRNPSA